MRHEPRTQGVWRKTVALPLEVAGILSALILALNFCVEILALLTVHRDHQTLLLVVLICLASWALLEVVLLRRRSTHLPLNQLLLLLALQFVIEVVRLGLVYRGPPIGIDRSYGIGVWHLEPLLALLPVYVVLFLAIGRALIATHTAETEAAYLALQESNQALERLATTDPLTGIFNRRYFEAVAAAEISRSQRYGTPLSLAIFDIDHFKSVNDRFGHHEGDQVLIRITHLARTHLRTSDTLARWGGEEFIILLPHRDAGQAAKVADSLRSLIARYAFDTVGNLSCSFGVAQLSLDETFDAWVDRADRALYGAKTSGRNAVCVA